MKKSLRLYAAGLLILLAAIPTLVVFAKEISAMTISGPGIKGEIKFDAHDDMYNLMDAGLIDTNGFMAAPKQELGTPYTINVFLNLDGKVVPFIRMDYYPMEPGQAGYVHITGRLDSESLREANDWAVMPLKADDLLRKLLDARGIALQSAVAAAAPAANPAGAAPAAPLAATRTMQPAYIALFAALAAIALLAGAGLLLRRRAALSR